MTNAEKFKLIFGVYATEVWAKTEKEFLKWLNEDVPETNDGDTISRQYAIENYQTVCRRTSCQECPLHIQVTDRLTDCELELFLHNLPSAQRNACEYWDDESNFCALNRPSAQQIGHGIGRGGMIMCANGWIPVSEQLPDDFQMVVVFWYEKGKPMSDVAFWQEDARRFDGEKWVLMKDTVIFWMPLPEKVAKMERGEDE